MTSPETSKIPVPSANRSGRALAGIKWKRTLARVLAALDIPRTDRRARTTARPPRPPYGIVRLVDPTGASYTAPLDDPCLDELLRRGYTVEHVYHVDPAIAVAWANS